MTNSQGQKARMLKERLVIFSLFHSWWRYLRSDYFAMPCSQLYAGRPMMPHWDNSEPGCDWL